MTTQESSAVKKKVSAKAEGGVKVRAPVPKKPPALMYEIEGAGTPSEAVCVKKPHQNSWLSSTLLNHVQRSMGYYATSRFGRTQEFPVSVLLSSNEGLIEMLEANKANASARALLDLLTQRKLDAETRLRENVEKGACEFWDLPTMLKPGAEVVYSAGEGLQIGGVVTEAKVSYTWTGTPYISVQLRVLHRLGRDGLQEGSYGAVINYFTGYRPLSKLAVRELTSDVRETLIERGKKLLWLNENPGQPVYASYDGQLIQSEWFGVKNFRAHGRIIVDVNTFRRIDSDQYDKEIRSLGVKTLNNDDHEDEELSSSELVETRSSAMENQAWRCFPIILGFSFAAKRWGQLKLDGVSPIRWRDDAFDKLVLEPRYKELVRALVEHSGGSFEDLVEGKGGGTIFLLHGPPGEGKTLTAEALAELLKRPLYSISVGELGIDPKSLENKLREVLDIATVWNAVILIDEADIFLEERDEENILRNAMVGVFLRLLEYHQGVLFLTTNRVKNIDHAFYSRISIALHFEKGGVEKRHQIWENLLNAAKVTGIDVEKLDASELNGRQIKSAIRQAQTLSRARNVPLTAELLREVVDLTTQFEREFKSGD